MELYPPRDEATSVLWFLFAILAPHRYQGRVTSEGTQGQTRGRAAGMPGLGHLLLRQVWKMSKGSQEGFRTSPGGLGAPPSWPHHSPVQLLPLWPEAEARKRFGCLSLETLS